jgi:hypothetical protein
MSGWARPNVKLSNRIWLRSLPPCEYQPVVCIVTSCAAAPSETRLSLACQCTLKLHVLEVFPPGLVT